MLPDQLSQIPPSTYLWILSAWNALVLMQLNRRSHRPPLVLVKYFVGFLLVYALLHFSGLMDRFGLATRDMLTSLGWYDYRRPVQLVLLVVAGILTAVSIWKTVLNRAFMPIQKLYIMLIASLLAVQAVKQWSYHDTDAIFAYPFLSYTLGFWIPFLILLLISVLTLLDLLLYPAKSA